MKAIFALLAIIVAASAQQSFLPTNSSSTCGVCCSLLDDRPIQNYTYYINTGHFIGGTGEWVIDTYGYSGNLTALNNPNDTCLSDLGPAPATNYQIGLCKDVMHGNVTRPCAFYLSPLDESQMCGRSAIFIHGCQCCTEGDQTVPPILGCSIGCIIIDYNSRILLRVNDYISVQKYEPGTVNTAISA